MQTFKPERLAVFSYYIMHKGGFDLILFDSFNRECLNAYVVVIGILMYCFQHITDALAILGNVLFKCFNGSCLLYVWSCLQCFN